VLIIGCGCRGRSLARELVERGHAVRGTTRSEAHLGAIEAAGAEGWVGDPDRVGTLAPALAGVGIVCVLLGSARGEPESLRSLHGSRLEMLLTRVLDTPVRGFAYEASGTVSAELLAGGARIVDAFCSRSRIPFALLDGARSDYDAWVASAAGAVEGLLRA
jgi:3-hydroxyisobutyrate dehydrogenase-like beta-hydroxyacid dehydrogenase